MSPLRSLALVAVVLFARGAGAEEGQGFAELRLSLFPGATGDTWQLVERVRPTFKSQLFERVKLVATVEAGFSEGRNLTRELERTLRDSDFGPLLEQAGCQWPEPSNARLGISGADDYLDVDRLYLDVYLGEVDVRVGRQALNWGSAQFFNPTDPFPEVLLAEPWRPRRGVNALRATRPFGEANDVSAVIATNDALNRVRAAARVRLNRFGTDFALVGAYRGDSENGLVGIDIRGTLGVGFWVEAAYLLGSNPHEEIAAGIDYSFPILERAAVMLQYYRNGAGATDPDSYQRLAGSGTVVGPECSRGQPPLFGTSTQRDPFAPFTVGRDYLLASAMLGILPELSANVAALQNLNDGSGMVIPTVSYSVLDWWDVAASAQVPYALWGRGGELKPRPEDLLLSAEVLGLGTLNADLHGLVPAATFTLWTRASF